MKSAQVGVLAVGEMGGCKVETILEFLTSDNFPGS